MILKRCSLISLAICMIVTPGLLVGQMENPTTQGGTSSFGAYQPNGIDTVNLQNGSVSLNIPLFSYPQRGTKLHLSFSIHYATPAWEFHILSSALHDDGIIYYDGYWTIGGSNTNTTPLGAHVVRDQAIAEVVNALQFPCDGSTNPDQNPCDITLGPSGPTTIEVDLMSLVTSDGGVHTIGEWEPSYETGAILTSTLDGTNFSPVRDASWPYSPEVAEILGPDGVTYTPASFSSLYGPLVFDQSDPEGNTITVGTTGWTDSLGRLIPGSTYGPGTGLTQQAPAAPPGGEPFPGITASSTDGCANGATAARVWNVPAVDGQTASYLLCYGNVSTSDPSFPNRYVSMGQELDSDGGSSGSASLLTQVVLPDNTSYIFTYYPDLTLSSITLPTGGSISYTYQTITWGLKDIAHPFSRAIATRKVTNIDGSQSTWSYAFSPVVEPGVEPGVADVTVTDPAGNQVVHTQTMSQDAAQYYQGSQSTGTLLKTEIISRSGSPLPFAYPGVDYYTPSVSGPTLSVQTTLPNGETSLVKNNLVAGTTPIVCYSIYQVESPPAYVNPFHGQCPGPLPEIQSVSEYAYGQGSPGPLLKTTTTNYQWQTSTPYATANMVDLPASVVVADGSGNTLSTTTYRYDEDNGSPQGVYGNLTSTSITGTNGASISSSTQFNTQGMPVKSNDGNGNPTTYTYADPSAASPTKVCLPPTNGIAHCSAYTWDPNTGKMLTQTAQNGVLTKYLYNDPLGRLTEIDAAAETPQETTKTFGYPTANITNVTADEQTLGDEKLKSSITVDGFGRKIHSTDTAGATVDTTYDSAGNVASVSNPYLSTSDPIYGITSFAYDALGRKTYQCQQDNSSTSSTTCTPGNSYQQWQYNGDTVTFTDESGKRWARTSDALGHLTEVVEDASGAKLKTDYQYDTLDDLTRVDQWGGSTGSSVDHERSFTYDGLGRLLTAVNPETGTTCYGTWNGSTCESGYDGNGNLIVKTGPRGIVTSYKYDSLNRLISKRSTDNAATPAVCYQYDQSSQAGASAYTVGRLVNEWTQSADANGGLCAATMPTSGTTLLTSRSILLYDAMGRVKRKQTCVFPACTTTIAQFPMAYTYDLAGNLTSYTNGNDSILYTKTYNAAGQLSKIESTLTGPKYPTPLFSFPTYSAAGALSEATYGTGTGIMRCRSYDNRLRVTGEIDTAGAIQGSALCPAQ